MMRMKQLLCTLILMSAATFTAYGASYTAQTVKISAVAADIVATDITDTKIITDSFSFKIPGGWEGNCVLVQDDNCWEIYNKASYDYDGSGLLYTIAAYDNFDYLNLSDYCILGWRGNTTYVLESDYIDTIADEASAEFQACKAAKKIFKDGFVTFINE